MLKNSLFAVQIFLQKAPNQLIPSTTLCYHVEEWQFSLVVVETQFIHGKHKNENVANTTKVTGASDKNASADCSIQNARMRLFANSCADLPLDGARYLLLEKHSNNTIEVLYNRVETRIG